MNSQRPSDLPTSDNIEFWGEGEKSTHTPVKVPMCGTHTKENWTKHRGYRRNEDGSISCTKCPWGTLLPGHYRLIEDYVIDLRRVSGSDK